MVCLLNSNLRIFENSKKVGNNQLHRNVRIFEYPDNMVFAVMQCVLFRSHVSKVPSASSASLIFNMWLRIALIFNMWLRIAC